MSWTRVEHQFCIISSRPPRSAETDNSPLSTDVYSRHIYCNAQSQTSTSSCTTLDLLEGRHGLICTPNLQLTEVRLPRIAFRTCRWRVSSCPPVYPTWSATGGKEGGNSVDGPQLTFYLVDIRPSFLPTQNIIHFLPLQMGSHRYTFLDLPLVWTCWADPYLQLPSQSIPAYKVVCVNLTYQHLSLPSSRPIVRLFEQ